MSNLSRTAVSAALLLTAVVHAQQRTASANGTTSTASGTTLQVTALRDDVLRVRAWRGNNAPEDASWAVLPEARTAHIAVTATPDGFATKALQVRIDPQLRLTVSDLQDHILQQDAAPITWDGDRFTVAKDRTYDDHFFGLGDKPGPLDRGGQMFTMWNTDAFGFQESTDPIYKDIPFFLDVKQGRTLGVFLDNTWRSNFDFGRADVNRYTFSALNGPVDYYLMYGPEPKEVMATWRWLTGPTPLPPLWALGFQQSRYSYFPESQLREIADRSRQDKIPTDVLWLDIDFQHKNWPFTIDEQNYPNFPGLVQDLAKQQFKLVVITDLHVAHQPNVGYAPYDSGHAGDHFVHNPDGTEFIGDVWPGPSNFPDFTQVSSRKWWGSLYKDFTAMGIAGFWNDMNEPSVFNVPGKTMPDNVQHRIDAQGPSEAGFQKRTATHLEIHNVYGMEQTRGTYEGQLRFRPNERPFTMTRASYAGGQRYAVTWTGDNSSTWNHLRMTVPQLTNLGLSGFSLAGADVGGFAGSPPPALLTKWLEYAAFQPIDRDHSAKGTRMHEVWVDGPEQEAIRRRYIEERYRLMPYLYTVAEEGSRTGLPMNRPMFLEFPHANANGAPMDTGGANFLLGAHLLIAPNPSPEEVADYAVDLPAGTWYNYWTGEQIIRRSNNAAIDLEQRDKVVAQKPFLIKPTLEDLPVFVRGGTILPIAPLVQSTQQTPDGPLTLRVYPPALQPASGTSSPIAEPCEGEVYTDDGHTLNYQRGDYARVHFTCTTAPDGAVTVHIAAQEGKYTPWWKQFRVEVVGLSPATNAPTAIIRGKATPLTQTEGRWGVTLPRSTKPTTVVMH
ncbi:TIM-barrel domain-containing protein [Terriglobus sp.]|uniref:glycoside hydrolase family 31 protein n=1 Tax=Terriglobus sp. TaxID=1889013 RepID=UPI003AFF8011